jgi:hypothetical protein
MKSTDQHLLEEAYSKVNEVFRSRYRTGHLDRYGKFIPKSNYKHAPDDEDSYRRKVQNDDRNAGLEDDYEEPTSVDPSPSFASKPSSSTPISTPPSSIDPSILSGKTFEKTMWDYPDYVITVNGKPRGRMMSKEEADVLVSILNSASKDTSVGTDPKVQDWLSGVEKMGDKL